MTTNYEFFYGSPERVVETNERTCHVIIEDECPVCSGCHEDIDPSWVACPYCGAKVVG